MAHGKFMTKEDVEYIKKWINKGLKTTDVAEITGRSRDTISKVRTGAYDYLLIHYETPEMPKQISADDKLDEILDVLNVIAERLGCGDA